MRSGAEYVLAMILAALSLPSATATGDTVELDDGTILDHCYVRDEGTRLLVWPSLDTVGSDDFRTVPRSEIAQKHDNPKIERDASWDTRPAHPDLTVAFIELNPKLPGLHGKVQYDHLGRPFLGGAPPLDRRAAELDGERRYLEPEYVAQDLKFHRAPGEPVTLTAHIRNVGFAPAQPFDYRWLIDDREVAAGRYAPPLNEMAEATIDYRYAWQDGRHAVTFEIVAAQREIATINNRLTEALWGYPVVYILSEKRLAAWHGKRSYYGTFSFEDYYRWHLQIMNLLFEASVYPSAPEGIIARVRLDNVIVLDEMTPEKIQKAQNADDGFGYYQAYWTWGDSPEEAEGDYSAFRVTTGTEWSLPHELGHQLGLVDYYAIDYAGDEFHVWPDNGEMVCHLHNHPLTMMAWHGPHPFNEADALYLNSSWDMPRGHFGDYYFALPEESILRIVDINGRGIPGARVEIYQRGIEIDTAAEPRQDRDATWYPVVEDGDFYSKPLSRDPVITGATDDDGLFRLPNRDVAEVKTLNGFHRRPNPFGNLNVVGSRGLMLAKITKNDATTWHWLEAMDFVIGWARGHRETFTLDLPTFCGSADSPPPPRNVRWERLEEPAGSARITWDPPRVRDQHFLDRPVAYRVYRRHGTMGMDDRPWYPVATVNAVARECVVDLDQSLVNDVEFYAATERFGVATVGELGVQSGIAQAAAVAD